MKSFSFLQVVLWTVVLGSSIGHCDESLSNDPLERRIEGLIIGTLLGKLATTTSSPGMTTWTLSSSTSTPSWSTARQNWSDRGTPLSSIGVRIRHAPNTRYSGTRPPFRRRVLPSGRYKGRIHAWDVVNEALEEVVRYATPPGVKRLVTTISSTLFGLRRKRIRMQNFSTTITQCSCPVKELRQPSS